MWAAIFMAVCVVAMLVLMNQLWEFAKSDGVRRRRNRVFQIIINNLTEGCAGELGASTHNCKTGFSTVELVQRLKNCIAQS